MSKDKIDDGGSVSPMYNLTLRDYFAAKAMQTMNLCDYEKYRHMALDAYAIADAMLAARKEDK